MFQLPNFIIRLLTVVAGVVLLVMSAAFVLLPYSLSAHPGETPSRAVPEAFHAT